MKHEICDAILLAGLDDWVPLLAIEGLARQERPNASDRDHQALMIEAVELLLRDGLVTAGIVTKEAGFEPWDDPIEIVVGRIGTACDRDRDYWAFAVWLRNTDAGDERARRIRPSTD